MIADNTKTADNDLRELSVNEIDAVSGGVLPILLAAFFIGFDVGLWTTLAIKRLS